MKQLVGKTKMGSDLTLPSLRGPRLPVSTVITRSQVIYSPNTSTGLVFTDSVKPLILHLKKIGGHKSFMWGHWYPCFVLLVTSALGFKTRVDSFACMLCHLCAIGSSDTPLVWHLLTSWYPAWWLSYFDPHTCIQVLVGLESRIERVAASQYVTDSNRCLCD